MSISAVLAVVRCLYVSLSVIHLYYVETAEYIITLFVGLLGPTFYFLSPFGVTKFQRNTLSGGVIKYTRVGKICNFRSLSRYILEMMRDRPITNRKSEVRDRSVSVPTTLSDLERWDVKLPFSSRFPYMRSYRLTIGDQIWHGNARGEGVCAWG